MTQYNLDKIYIQYNEQVLNNDIVACNFIYLACKRMKEWFDRDDIYFDYDDVDLKIRFMQKLKHSKGKFANKYFELLPYQQWMVANIIGWKWTETKTRVINTALLMLSRKCGKTFFAAALMLAIIMTDKEQGAEGYMIANTSQQAGICFDHCKNQCSSIDPKGKIFSRYRSEIRIPLLKSKIQVLSSDTSSLDGLNPSIFCVDEYHEAKSEELFNVLRTGQGMRENPLGIIISTAGFHPSITYPLYRLWDVSKNVLEGLYTQDTLFAAIYQLDDEDDYKDEEVWVKSNPSLGQTVTYKYLREQVEQATNNPAAEVSVKTKSFNCWVNSSETWIFDEKVQAVTQHFELTDFDQEEHYSLIGVDIAFIDDLCCFDIMIEKEGTLYFKIYPFCSRTALVKSQNKDLYKQWIKDGYMILVDDDCIDLDWVIKWILDTNEIIPIGLVAYDPYSARSLGTRMTKEGIPVKGIGQGLANFAEPTAIFEQRVSGGKNIVLDDNPVIRWAISNVKIKRDEFGNQKPVKSEPDRKIDPVITMIQSLKMWLDLNGLNFDNTEVTILEN